MRMGTMRMNQKPNQTKGQDYKGAEQPALFITGGKGNYSTWLKQNLQKDFESKFTAETQFKPSRYTAIKQGRHIICCWNTNMYIDLKFQSFPTKFVGYGRSTIFSHYCGRQPSMSIISLQSSSAPLSPSLSCCTLVCSR